MQSLRPQGCKLCMLAWQGCALSFCRSFCLAYAALHWLWLSAVAVSPHADSTFQLYDRAGCLHTVTLHTGL